VVGSLLSQVSSAVPAQAAASSVPLVGSLLESAAAPVTASRGVQPQLLKMTSTNFPIVP
jgi:hypothetical protein